MSLPVLLVIFVVYLFVYAAVLNGQVAAAVFFALLFGWLVFILRTFALMQIGMEATGMVVRSRLTRRDHTPWECVRIRHVFGPFFAIGNPPTRLTTFLASLIVGRPRRFRSELNRHGALLTRSQSEVETDLEG